MISLKGVKDFIKSLGIGENFSVGRIDETKNKSIGVYSRAGMPPVIPVGGLANKSYDVKAISILVHWNNNAAESEWAALQLFDAIQTAANITIDSKKVKFIRLNYEPIDVTDSDSEIYEYVIQADIIVER